MARWRDGEMARWWDGEMVGWWKKYGLKSEGTQAIMGDRG